MEKEFIKKILLKIELFFCRVHLTVVFIIIITIAIIAKITMDMKLLMLFLV